MQTQLPAQKNWGAYRYSINAVNLRGKHFRMTADAKAIVTDDSASVRLWARVDNRGGNGFFNNMWPQPIRSTVWKNYKIEGDINADADSLLFGIVMEYNGRFFCDNLKLEIQNNKKWETVYLNNFETATDVLPAGIAAGNTGINKLYHAAIAKTEGNAGNVLTVTGSDLPNYGINQKAGGFVENKGANIYYEVYGTGKPLVVLHGNGGSISNAADFYPELIKKYRVIAIDSRSQGRSTDTDAPLNYDVMASDVNAVLDKLNIDSAFMWGQSDGGILCLLMAMDYPKKVKRIIACGANVQPDSSAIFGWGVLQVNKTIKNSADKHEVKLYEMMRDYPNIPYENLKRISAPSLIMGGDRDIIKPEHLVKMFQYIPNSQLCILPGSTHGEAWENQEIFLMIMDKFFNKPFTMPDTKDWFN